MNFGLGVVVGVLVVCGVVYGVYRLYMKAKARD